MLAAAGMLDHCQFGPPIPVARRGDGEVNVADGANPRRRSIYLQILRLAPVTLLQSHDQPVMAVNCTRRGQSTVATQALTLLNSDAVANAARELADRARAAASTADFPAASPAAPQIATAESSIRFLGLAAWAREFSVDEVAELKRFLATQTAAYAAAAASSAAVAAPVAKPTDASVKAPANASANATVSAANLEHERKAWIDLAHMLLAANEFVYID
jgi:transposase